MIQMSQTKKFTEIYDDVTSFLTDYGTLGIPTTISTTNCQTLYYLLYAKYGNNFITNLDETQWKYKLFAVIYEYGPTWEKRLEIQENLRSISDADLLKGAEAIYNHAINPSTEPATDTRTPLPYINDQNTTLYNKSEMDAYTQLWNLLATDVTEAFLSKFSYLFKKIWNPICLYESEED